jgi:hypothetical protein
MSDFLGKSERLYRSGLEDGNWCRESSTSEMKSSREVNMFGHVVESEIIITMDATTGTAT